MKIDKEHCRAHASELRETNDCTVRACAVAAQIEYPVMHEYLKACGRKHRRGMRGHAYRKALAELGFDLIQLQGPVYEYKHTVVDGCWKYNCRTGTEHWVNDHFRTTRRAVKGSGIDYQSLTVTRLQRELTSGTYLVNTDGHVLALVDGVVHDYTDGRRHRIESVWRVTEGTGKLKCAPIRTAPVRGYTGEKS